MALSIWQLFASNALTARYGATSRGFQSNPLYDAYRVGTPARFEEDQVRVLDVSSIGEPAPLNNAGQPARVLDLVGAGDRTLTAYRAFNVIPIQGLTLDLLASFDPNRPRDPSPVEAAVQRQAEGMLDIQMRHFARRHVLAKQLFVAKTLTSGAIYIGEGGQILESDTGAVQTLPTGIPAANMGGDYVGTVWTDSSSTPLDDLDAMNDAAESAGVAPLRHVWLHTSLKSSIRANTQMKEFFTGGTNNGQDAEFGRAVRSGDMVQVGEYTFHFYGGTYTAADGTRKPFIPTTKAIVTPDPQDGEWVVHGDCKTPVPSETGVYGDLAAALNTLRPEYGDFSYVATQHNVTGVQVFAGFAEVFGLAAPESVYVPTIAA
ncbi:major capsid protein [Alienimonas sp. DA493]|uniref:major capsid protein n=1 Tax=Alienimonas sp. DA493 TaxID=3373605 RepID=UPI0037540FA4